MSGTSLAPEAAAVALARSQHGLLTTRQALACGLTRRVLACRAHDGVWAQLHRGVWIVGSAPDTYEQRLHGRLLFSGDDAVASHASAARLWGLPGFGDRIEWTRPRGRSQRRPYGWCHGSCWLPPGHVTTQRGIPVTTPARTVFDLAGVVHPGRVERALDTALARKLCSYGDLVVVFSDLARRGRRGTVTMRDLLDTRGPGYVPPSSELEALGRSVLVAAGLSGFEVETDLGDEDWIGRVDLLYRTAHVVIELDGRTYHQSSLDSDADRRRDNRLMTKGWRVLRFTWGDLRDQPAQVVAQVREALTANAA